MKRYYTSRRHGRNGCFFAFLLLAGFLALLLLLASCSKELKPVSAVVIDPVRHYYPVVQGEPLGVTYEIENTSEWPLFIREVQTSCGCVVPRDDLPIVVLPHKRGTVHVEFNTIKNTGYVSHYVYCYGNFEGEGYVEMTFDTNVVPRADYVHDYEQLWQEQERASGRLKEFVDGKSSHKGYFCDDGTDRRAEFIDAVNDAVDALAP
ncbi:MAG: DUF1573 domain-containing protein [Alloprevotella sp.]|nr:DUF1573 domain-containing protein [Alloprevotella sp.]